MSAASTPTSTTAAAAVRAVLLLPVSLALVIPALIIVVDPGRRPLELPSVLIGLVLGVTGAAMVGRTATDLFTIGRGTVAPWDRPSRLVTSGLFAHSRNPFGLGVLAVLAGLAMASRSPILGAYLLASAAVLHLQIVRNEEPWAARSFPDQWPTYRGAVPRWIPRMRR